MAIALLGFISSDSLNRRQAVETNTRLYSELMSRREESESALRKDMCVSIIGSFVKPTGGSLNSDVLNLELLAYNFHESLNLKPLFLDLRRRDRQGRGRRPHRRPSGRRTPTTWTASSAWRARSSRKQMIVLEGVGKKVDRTVDLTGDPEGTSLEPATLTLDGVQTTFSIDVLGVDRENREIRLGAQHRDAGLRRWAARPRWPPSASATSTSR